MVHTLPEYAKTFDDPKKRGVVQLFPEYSDILRVLPLKNAPGGRYGYFREGQLPTNMGFRGINETPQEGHGIVNDFTEQCFPIAGNIDVDRALINRFGPDRRATEEAMSIKSKAEVWTRTFIEGDNQSEPREFTGLKQRLKVVGGSVDGTNYESRLVANGTGSGGAAPSLKQLDATINIVEGCTHILMNRFLKMRLIAAARDTSLSGFITHDKDDMGKRITRYGDVEIITGYGISKHGELLNFNEVAYGGGGAVTTSIYCINFSEMGVCGIETSPMEVTDKGLLDDCVNYRTNVEHDCGIVIESPYAVARLSSITNAAWAA